MDFAHQVFAAVIAGLSSEVTISIVAAIVVALVAGYVITPIRGRVVKLGIVLSHMWSAQTRIMRALAALDGNGIWLSRPPVYPQNKDQYSLRMQASIPIITLANLKGGVGKTTLAANLAAFYAINKGERVLLIDLDFQGSLSSMVVAREDMIGGAAGSKARRLVAGELNAQNLIDAAVPCNRMERAKVISSYYDLAIAENSTMIRWLLGEEGDDVRYRLASVLLDPMVQQHFNRVIIDAPPRMTTAAIQAFCASTHALIPTILDGLSGDAVATFVDELQRLKEAGLCPHLRVLGVVATMTASNIGRKLDEEPDADPPLTVAERQGVAVIRAALQRIQIDRGLKDAPAKLLPLSASVQRLAIIANQAGENVVYTTGNEAVTEMFERVGREIDLRLKGYEA